MTVYLLIDDKPEDFGGYQLIAIYKNKKKAQRRCVRLINKDNYTYQYLEVIPRRVIE